MQCPRAALLFVISVVAIEAWFWYASEPLSGLPFFEPRMDEAVLIAKRRMAQKAAGKVILVGDSSCGMDLIPDEVEQTLRQPVLNLGTLANFTVPGFTLLAEEAMQCQPPPRALVFVMLPHTLCMTEKDARDFGQLGRYMLAYNNSSDVYLPSFEDRRNWIFFKHRFNLFPPEAGGSFQAFFTGLEERHGWSPERSEYTGCKNPRTGFAPSPFSSDALRSFALKAKQRSIPVWFWWAPSPVDAYDSAYRQAAQQELRVVAASVPWLHIPQTEAPIWPDSKFGSVTHLKPEAAREHSALFARILREYLDDSMQKSGDVSFRCPTGGKTAGPP
jgi:hypothetical protein